MWLPNQFMGFAMMVFIALTEVRIADNVGDADIKLLAHLAAFLAACVALMFSVNAVLGTRNYGRFLRRIERK
jgi:hypothetical protein